jgi:hypothetical protein
MSKDSAMPGTRRTTSTILTSSNTPTAASSSSLGSLSVLPGDVVARVVYYAMNNKMPVVAVVKNVNREFRKISLQFISHVRIPLPTPWSCRIFLLKLPPRLEWIDLVVDSISSPYLPPLSLPPLPPEIRRFHPKVLGLRANNGFKIEEWCMAPVEVLCDQVVELSLVCDSRGATLTGGVNKLLGVMPLLTSLKITSTLFSSPPPSYVDFLDSLASCTKLQSLHISQPCSTLPLLPPQLRKLRLWKPDGFKTLTHPANLPEALLSLDKLEVLELHTGVFPRVAAFTAAVRHTQPHLTDLTLYDANLDNTATTLFDKLIEVGTPYADTSSSSSSSRLRRLTVNGFGTMDRIVRRILLSNNNLPPLLQQLHLQELNMQGHIGKHPRTVQRRTRQKSYF